MYISLLKNNHIKKSFTHGQIISKATLCRLIEEHIQTDKPEDIWVLAGWTGLLPFVLTVRNNFEFKDIKVFDRDATALLLARQINNNLETVGRFAVQQIDINHLMIPSVDEGGPGIVINTSCEHFNSFDWWRLIPDKTWIVLQGTNMPHQEHVCCFRNLDHMINHFPMNDLKYSGEQEIQSGNKLFSRYTLIGKK